MIDIHWAQLLVVCGAFWVIGAGMMGIAWTSAILARTEKKSSETEPQGDSTDPFLASGGIFDMGVI